MKRYLLFSCCSYYPMGGVNDLKGCFTKTEILNILKNNINDLDDYINIFDLKTMTPIKNIDESEEDHCYEEFDFTTEEDYEDNHIKKLIEIIKVGD